MDATIIFNETTAHLDSPHHEVHTAAYTLMECEIEGARFSHKYRMGQWNGKTSFYHRLYRTFPSGLVSMLAQQLETMGYSVEIFDRRTTTGVSISPDKIPNCLDGVTLRDYQVKAVEEIFSRTCGIVRLPTGSGKTKTAIAAMRLAADNGGIRSLFLTHKKDLLHQTARDIEVCTGIKSGIVGDGTKTVGQITVATVQTLSRAIKDPKVADLLKSVRMVICDECHHASAKTFKTVIEQCKSAYYRIGLTATPLMKTKLEDLQLVALTGEIIHRVSMQDLIDRGFLAQPLVKFIPVSEPTLPRNLDWRDAYLEGVVHNRHRNLLVTNEAAKFASVGLSTLILINELDHGNNIAELLESYRGLRFRYISGEDSSGIRKSTFDEIAKGQIDVLLSSTILDEGVDLPSVNAVINAGGWKSRVRVYQKIGRGMRPKASGENVVYIVDFADMTQKHLIKHSMERLSTVNKEEGFRIVTDFGLAA